MSVTLRRLYIAVLSSLILVTVLLLPTAGKAETIDASAVTEERTAITNFSGTSGAYYSATGGYGNALFVPDSQQSITYTTPSITPTQPTTAVGVLFTGNFQHNHAEGDHTVTVVAHINATDGTQQSRHLPIMHGDQKNQLEENMLSTSPVMVENVASYTVEVILSKDAHGHAPRIDSMQIIGLNTGDTNTSYTPTTSITTSSDELDVISRSEWGADESYRYVGGSESGEEVWPIELQDKKAFIVHHTAGTDGGSDPAASVRAIYYWHAVVLGWGDIGYNYLIDPDGNVYTGRAGGARAKAAHAYNSSDNIDYNEGTVGIALLGCFEETPGACYTQHSITPEAEAALALLIGEKATELGFDPETETVLHGETVPRVLGHRDVDYTYCPGSNVHNDLSTVRSMAANVYEQSNTSGLEGSYTSSSVQSVNENNEATGSIGRKKLVFSDTYQITVSYRNTGTTTWTQQSLRLKAFNKSGKKQSPMHHDSWNGKYGGLTMNQQEVEPGETATFTFLISSPRKPGNKQLFTKLYMNGNKVGQSNGQTALKFTSEYNGGATLVSAPFTSYAGNTHTITVTVTNDGEQTWPEEAVLMTGNQTLADVPALAPGESATVTFQWTAPDTAQTAYLKARIKQNGYRIPGTRIATAIYVHEQ